MCWHVLKKHCFWRTKLWTRHKQDDLRSLSARLKSFSSSSSSSCSSNSTVPCSLCIAPPENSNHAMTNEPTSRRASSADWKEASETASSERVTSTAERTLQNLIENSKPWYAQYWSLTVKNGGVGIGWRWVRSHHLLEHANSTSSASEGISKELPKKSCSDCVDRKR